MNTNAGDIDHHAANHVEKQVLSWIKEMIGYPAEASGLLTSGCSAANLLGLTVARNSMADFDLRKEGVSAGSQENGAVCFAGDPQLDPEGGRNPGFGERCLAQRAR